MKDQLYYHIALSLVPGVGDKTARNLITHFGSATAIFKQSKKSLLKIGGIGMKLADAICSANFARKVEKEIQFIERNGIRAFTIADANYPSRLRNCDDAPIVFFQKGDVDLNRRKVLGIVGTRRATSYGREFCRDFVAELKPFHPVVISGLAYGTDINAHRAALDNGLPTVAVLAHGLDRIYPGVHQGVARQMTSTGGGLVTEYLSGTNPDKENFPRRNRIIAGLCDAIIVVEAGRRGGALITAEIANTYNRDVFAVPGRLSDRYSEGCNRLIKTNKAALITGTADLTYLLDWKTEDDTVLKNSQHALFVDLTDSEKEVYEVLRNNNPGIELEKLCIMLNLPVSRVSELLMIMEIKGVVRNKPGKIYELL